MRVGSSIRRCVGVVITSALAACVGGGETIDDTAPASDSSSSASPSTDSTAVATSPPGPGGSQPPSCGVQGGTGGTRLTGGGIGALRIGTTLDQIRSRCMVLSEDTAALGPEGQREHRVVVVTGSVNTTATLVNGRVWRLYVASPVFRTTDSLGVGSRVSDLRTPNARLARGEGTFVLRRDHCGLSFQLGSGVPPTAQTLDAVPDSVRVSRVLVIGC